MLREVVNAVVLTFVVSEWLSEKPGRRLVLFARRDASTKALCAGLGVALLLVNFVGDHVPALGGLLASNVVVAVVEGAVLAAGAYGTAKITRRPCLCGVPTLTKGDVDKSAFLRAFVVCTILCYVQGGMAFAHVYVPRAVVAAAAFVAVLYVDVRRTVDVELKTFGKELAKAAAYVAPLYPLLAILCSLIFVLVMSVFEKAGWNLRRLDAPIFYTVFYGPFSAVYVFAKRALLDSRYGLPVSASRRAGAAAVAREMS